MRKSEFQVNTYIAGDQSSPAVASFPDGIFIVTWNSNGQISSYDIFAQIYKADGTRIGSEFLVNTNTTDSQFAPEVTTLADGGFLITWSSMGQDGSNLVVYAQRFDTNGTCLGLEFRVNIFTTNDQFKAFPASLGEEGFVILWQSYNQLGQNYEIYMQKYDLNGNSLFTTDMRVNNYITDDQSRVAAAVSKDNSILAVWNSNYQDGNKFGIYARLLNVDGDSIPFGDSSCSLYNNVCDSPSSKIYNTNTQGIYDLATQQVVSGGYNPFMDYLSKKGLVISFSFASVIQSNQNAVESLGNGLETAFYDLIVLGACFVCLCLYIMCQRQHLDSAGRCYNKQTGVFTNTLKAYCEELSGLTSLYWLIRPVYLLVKAQRLTMRVDYGALCDQSSQQALFVLLFFLAKRFKLNYLRRLMERKLSSQKGILANWRVFLQDVLVIILVSSIQVFLPSKIHDSSFLGKCSKESMKRARLRVGAMILFHSLYVHNNLFKTLYHLYIT